MNIASMLNEKYTRVNFVCQNFLLPKILLATQTLGICNHLDENTKNVANLATSPPPTVSNTNTEAGRSLGLQSDVYNAN